MRCPGCGLENPEGMQFCGQCATPLPVRQKGKRATGQKAKRQPTSPDSGPRPPEPGPSLARRRAAEGERRQLTVMFCDLVGSTALSEQLDPEELREVILAYQETCAQVIHRFEGYIARYGGDGLLVYFGYPQAHEDDAQRAVRAGLGILAELQQLNSRLQQTLEAFHELPLQVRIGIHTGLVVAGEMGGGAYPDPMAIVGETPNIASRVQGVAEPDTVVISAATYRLTQGFFECLDLGSHMLKGVSTPVPMYRVLRQSGAQSRFEVAVTAGLTPLVGREQEMGLLLERWGRVREGEGQVVLLSGEAGIGKSRLVQALKERVAGETHTRLECRCSPYYQNSAFYPVIDLVQRALQFSREDSPQEKLSKLEGVLARYPFSLQQVVPLFASLLSLPLPDRYTPLTLTPQRQRQKTLEASLAWLLEMSERQPVLFVVEDLLWADPSTLEFLNLLIDQIPTARILTLLTFRSEFSPPWAPHSHITQLRLTRLPHKQVEVMVRKVARDKALPAEVVRQLVAKADGVPLFVEELTKTVLESGHLIDREDHYELTGSQTGLEDIPVALQDSLTARLDRLGTVKETAQLGAALGREFPYELLQAVSLLDERTLQRDLARLTEAELLYQRGLPPQARYLFKHALIQEAAYQSLLKSKRQQVHQQIAQILEERFSEIKETQPELLAHHYTEAGRIGEAIPYWQKAGRRAVERSAQAEAISHLTRGLELLKVLPDTEERAQQELTLHLALGGPLIATKGYGAPEVEKAYARAFELCRQSRETPYLLQAQLGLAAFYSMRGQFQKARQLGEQCLFLAQQMGDPSRLLQAQWTLGQTLFHIGEFLSAREHVEHALALYDPRHHRSRAVQDLGVTSHSYLSWGLWLLGYPDQALATSHMALTLAQGLSHPFSVAFALIFAAGIHQFRGEGLTAQELAEKAIGLCREQGFPVWLAFGLVVRGWALAGQGREEEGIAQIRQGLTAWKATGAEASRPFVLALLAEAHGRVGQAEEGLNILEEALAIAHGNEERYFEAELYRLKGELTLKQFGVRISEFGVPNPQPLTPSPPAEAEAKACFLKAIEIARRQSMKSLELRAVMSLSRLWRHQGKTEEARQMLAEIYGWFTEGFDTADLKAAKALLEQLSRNPFEQTPTK